MTARYFLSALALLLVAACSKHQEDVEEPVDKSPVVSLVMSHPTANGSYHNGDTVRFAGLAISTESIHGYDIYIRRAGDSANIFYNHYHDHNDTLHIDAYWVNDRVTPQDLEGTILLYLDHEGHELRKTIPFKAL
jgi:hypothetical protein